MDDLRVYDRALTQAEVQTDMTKAMAESASADTSAPSAPSAPSASGRTQTSITLSWNASSDNVGVAGYGLYRDGNGAGSTDAATRSFTFSGLTCGTSYTLAVDAYDTAGNRSSRTSQAVSTTACAQRPDGLSGAVCAGEPDGHCWDRRVRLGLLAGLDRQRRCHGVRPLSQRDVGG